MPSCIRALLLALALYAAPLPTHSQIPVLPDWSADQQGGTGFFDPSASPVAGHASLGELRRALFNAAAAYVGSLFTPSYPGEVIRVQASFENLGFGLTGGGGTLGYVNNFGSANPLYQPDTDYPQALANHLAARDVVPGNTIEIKLNSNPFIVFDYSTNATPAPGSGVESLFVTMVHELMHGLGFANYINPFTGEYEGFPTAFDRLLVRGATSPALLTSMTDGQRLAAITSNDLYWNGSGAMSANGGSRVKLYAPATYVEKTSVMHLDTTTFNPAGLVMLPGSSPTVQSQLALAALERAMLYDLGWTPSRPRIASLTRDGGQSTVTFTGLLQGKYRLRHTGALATSNFVNGWTVVPGTVTAGWGSAVLTHTITGEAGFYAVEMVP